MKRSTRDRHLMAIALMLFVVSFVILYFLIMCALADPASTCGDATYYDDHQFEFFPPEYDL